MTIEAIFVRSAAGAGDLPRDGLAEIALVGRSNVGKSSLINALVRRTIARTSGAPGKTRLANLYRVRHGAGPAFYLVDVPGYGFARGDRTELETAARAYFWRDRPEGQERPGAPPGFVSVLLLVDARHPGLAIDGDAWRWLRSIGVRAAVVATKMDKLARGQRIRATGVLESVFDGPVVPVSAVTGEGLDELWTLIDRLANISSRLPRPSPGAATAPTKARPTPQPGRKRRTSGTGAPRRSSGSTSRR